MIRLRDNAEQWLDWDSNPTMIRSSSLRHPVQTGSWGQRIYQQDITAVYVDETCNSLKKIQEVWSNHVGVLYNKDKNLAQLADSEICIRLLHGRCVTSKLIPNFDHIQISEEPFYNNGRFVIPLWKRNLNKILSRSFCWEVSGRVKQRWMTTWRSYFQKWNGIQMQQGVGL